MKYSIIKTEDYVPVNHYNNLHTQYVEVCESNDRADELLEDMTSSNRLALDANEGLYFNLLIYKFAGIPLAMLAGAFVYRLFSAT